MPGLELPTGLVAKLSRQEPRPTGLLMASVAVVLDGTPPPRVLLIKRAERIGDPWSGQVAFPGGKSQEGDGSLRQTAVRETREELGLDLSGGSRFLGYFRTFRTHTGTMDVVPSVFSLEEEARLTPNGEVSAYFWAELGRLSSPDAAAVYRRERADGAVDMPAFRVGGHVVWGLTYRILSDLIQGGQPSGHVASRAPD